MELTEVTNFRREVLTRISRYAWHDELPERIYDMLDQVVTENTTRVRCCVHKERAVLKNRIGMALGLPMGINIVEAAKIALANPMDDTLPIIDVLPEACDQCPIDKFLVTDACRHCVAHKCMNKCPKDAISIHQNRAYIDKTKCIECGMCKKSCPYGAIIEVSRPCERSCVLGAIHAGADRKATIDTNKCVTCGACRSACPFGAIDERSSILQVIKALKTGQKVYALLAPSFVGQFGFKVTPEQVAAALKQLGFAGIKEVAFGADMAALAEAKELQEKVPDKQQLLTSSCCPSFVDLVHKHLPELAGLVSETVSPMVATGRYLKAVEPDAVAVFIGPCIAKKVEARANRDAIDFVLTYEELACLFAGVGIDPEQLEVTPEGSAATPLGIGFPLAGGVRNAVLDALGEGNSVETHYARGLENCIRELNKAAKGEVPCSYFEGMACDNGCLEGPGALANYNIVQMLLKQYAHKSACTGLKDNTAAIAAMSKINMEVSK